MAGGKPFTALENQLIRAAATYEEYERLCADQQVVPRTTSSWRRQRWLLSRNAASIPAAARPPAASVTARILSRRVVYFGGIGHADVRVGEQVYKLAVSHHFQGRSIYNPVHGAQRYLVMQGHDREIAACGDSHVPGMLKFVHGAVEKLAINAGSTHTGSGYARRYFSLTTHPVFPCFVLDPGEHRVTPYWSVADWLAATR